MNIARNKDYVEYEIAERQLVMKDEKEKSWFNFIKSILETYNLPSIFYLFEKQMSKSEWKKTLAKAINTHIEAMWRADIVGKSSLKYINPFSLKVGQTHPVWASVRNSLVDNRRAQIKCKLLTGSYILQGNRAAFNQYTVDATCKLCQAAPETRQHFIAECSAYTLERDAYAGKLKGSQIIPYVETVDLSNPEVLTQLTLDGSAQVAKSEDLEVLELYSREYIEQIHRKRIARLKHISQC